MKKGFNQLKAQMWNKSYWIDITDPANLKNIYKNRLDEAGFCILQLIDHYFMPQGYTALFLLSDSHLAIHTFPEECKTYIEISSCVKSKYDNFIKLEFLTY